MKTQVEDNQLEISSMHKVGENKKNKEDEIDDSILCQPSLTVMDENEQGHNDNPVSKDLHRNKDVFFGVDNTAGKPNPWKVGNTLTLCYNSNNDPIITIGPHCNIFIIKILFIVFILIIF